MVAPGLLREIFQMSPEAPRVTPTIEAAPRPGSGPKVRASPPAVIKGGAVGDGPVVQPKVLDGWSSQTTRSKTAP